MVSTCQLPLTVSKYGSGSGKGVPKAVEMEFGEMCGRNMTENVRDVVYECG